MVFGRKETQNADMELAFPAIGDGDHWTSAVMGRWRVAYFAAPIQHLSMASMRYSVLAIALAGTAVASAQITLVDPGNVPVVGTSFQVHAGPWVAPLAGGEWQNYDLSALTDTATNTYSWMAPSESPNSGMFPDATLMLVSNGPDTVVSG
jgi:hypothetical protein